MTSAEPDDERFMENVVEARENGYDRVCAGCGCGMVDDSDIHERDCPLDPDPGRLERELRASRRLTLSAPLG